MTEPIRQVLDRIKGLKQFVVRVHVPEDFEFTGTVPFDMEIVGSVAMVTVWATDHADPQQRPKKSLPNPPQHTSPLPTCLKFLHGK